MPPTGHLPDIVAEAARRFGERPAIVDVDGSVVTYRALHERTLAVARGLRARGVGEGDVVALTLPSEAAYVLAYLGAASVGAVTAGVNPRLAAPEQAACLARVSPRLVLRAAGDVEALERAGSASSDELPALAPDPDRVVCIIFTSGTTGTPKGAWFAERQIAAVTAIDVGDRWGSPDERLPMLAATQLAHVGFMTKLAWYLRLGSTQHLLARWRSADVLDLVERERIPSLGGVAPQVALLLRDPTLDQRDLSSVQTLVMGGAASSPTLVREARRRFGAAYSIRYSSTESGGVGTGTAFDAGDDEALHTVGRPRPGVEVRILGEDGRPLPDGEVGQVALRSGAVMGGYWHDPEATAAALVDGWLRTGDRGWIDAEGRLVLAGRGSDLFIRGGYNVFPAEVEAVLEQHPAVDQVAVVPRPDEVMGEVAVAVVVPVAGVEPPTLADLRDFAADRLARFKLPEGLLLVDELPLTPMQKLDRRGLMARVARTGSPGTENRPGRRDR